MSEKIPLHLSNSKKLPGACGVYKMIGETGKCIYVGKAKNLKKRVSSIPYPRL